MEELIAYLPLAEPRSRGPAPAAPHAEKDAPSGFRSACPWGAPRMMGYYRPPGARGAPPGARGLAAGKVRYSLHVHLFADPKLPAIPAWVRRALGPGTMGHRTWVSDRAWTPGLGLPRASAWRWPCAGWRRAASAPRGIIQRSSTSPRRTRSPNLAPFSSRAATTP